MKTIVGLMLVSMLVIVATPVFSGTATQMWNCEMDDDATEDMVKAKGAEWLKAARTMKGGEQLEAHVFFPVAVNGTGETDFLFVLSAPSFEEWGKFWDNYAGSPADKADAENNDLVSCPDSVLWESVKIK